MIGGKIKLIRKSYNITLKELSNRTGLSVSFFSCCATRWRSIC